MSKFKKALIIISAFIVIFLGTGGIYLNYWLGSITSDINDYTHLDLETLENPKTTNDPGASENSGFLDSKDNPVNPSTPKDISSDKVNKIQGKDTPSDKVNTIQNNVDKPLEKMDVIKTGAVILKKLSPREIDFLYNFSSGDYSKEELIEAREILLTKLTPDDLTLLKAMGKKYGKSLRILDPNVPIQ